MAKLGYPPLLEKNMELPPLYWYIVEKEPTTRVEPAWGRQDARDEGRERKERALSPDFTREHLL